MRSLALALLPSSIATYKTYRFALFATAFEVFPPVTPEANDAQK